ncbi:BCCT family transporter [Streptomyces sp. ACA25]|uniref:BCCT family transporter n=1 Tax=Streptomyces sp. ACA25 TaxID=3022596 RepID=UPI0023074B0D|nr:BCCT family transporter [Streptomyces sp. ACA25]MDB1087092.1 BCCT family transporter [Streptomyces sp. ACA25]
MAPDRQPATPGGAQQQTLPRPQPRFSSIAPRVFWPSALLILVFVVWAVAWPEEAANVVERVDAEIIGGLGWFYMITVSLFVIFVIWLGVSRFGDIKLGKAHDTPDFSTHSWLAMLFAAGMGIGLMFWGVAEPLSFYAEPKPGTLPADAELGEFAAERSDFAMSHTFMHWGLHPWAIYVVVGLAIAYAVHRRGRPVSIRWALEPLFGDRVKGAVGDVIDVIALIGTVFGVATSLGFGVLQISAGMDALGWVDDPGTAVQVALIIGITLLALVSVLTGLARGIKWLSNVNMGLAGGLLLFVLVAGPTLVLLTGFVDNIGFYLQNLAGMSFDTGASQGSEGRSWVDGWTVFYWGWWISWAPFVGIFIARISKGRTVRQFVAGVLLVPVTVTFVWFSVLGGAAISEVRGDPESGDLVNPEGLTDPEVAAVDTDRALFQLLDLLPAGTFVAAVAVLLVVLFFVTSSDSGSYVVDMLASGGDPDPPSWSRAFWASVEGAVAIALLVAVTGTDALGTLRTTAIIIALPFTLVMIAMCFATLKQFREERAAHLAALAQRQEDELVGYAVAAFEESQNGTGSGTGNEEGGAADTGRPHP